MLGKQMLYPVRRSQHADAMPPLNSQGGLATRNTPAARMWGDSLSPLRLHHLPNQHFAAGAIIPLSMHAFLLLHAPLSAPASWQLVADVLRSRGYPVLVPDLTRVADAGPPYWPRYGAAAGQPLISLPDDLSVVVVAHSGAGFFVPLLRQATGAAIPCYIFVDAVVPEDGVIPDADGYMRSRSRDGRIPPFTEAELRATGLPGDAARALQADLRPLPLAVYEEPVPVFPGWPDAPRAYLRFTQTWPEAYQHYVDQARQEGWPYAELAGGHFHMLVNPQAVADALLTLVRQSTA